MFNRQVNRWWLVVAGALGCAGGAGVVATYVLGIFVKSISAEFGWGRSYVTAGISCFYIVSGLGSLVLGSVLARYSIRWITTLSVLLFAASIVAVSLLPPSVVIFCLVFAFMGFFGSAATAMPYAIAIARRFDRNRGTALALVVSGSGLGALFMPNIASAVLIEHGWRAGYMVVGLFVGAVSLTGLILFFRDPPRAEGAPIPTHTSLLDIYRSGSTFWLIALSILAISVALVGLITNMVPILTDRGIAPIDAASVVGLLGAASWVSRIGLGVLLDRVHAKYIAAGIFLISAVGIAMIAQGASGPLLYTAAVCIGLGIGAEADLLTFMMSRYFPIDALPRALGAVWIFWAWGNGAGVFLGSLSYDLTGSYDIALYTFLALAGVACVLVLRLGSYVTPVAHDVIAPSREPAPPPGAAR